MKIRRSICLLTLCLTPLFVGAERFNAQEAINRAIELVQDGQYSLARSYLDPALIDFRISSAERSRAYYIRGFAFYRQGFLVSARKDYNRALEFNADNKGVLVALGRLHWLGEGTPKAPELALRLFQKAADLGHPPANFHIGHAYLMGEGVEKDVLKAREVLTLAAQEGHVDSMLQLAASYRAMVSDSPDLDAAREWYGRAVEAGSAEANVALGFMAQNGESGERDAALALALFTEAAKSGSGAGHASAGHLYLVGDGVAQDLVKAREHFAAAAALNVAAGHLGLGHIYESGLAVPVDEERAEQHYRQAASTGHAPSTQRLVSLLLKRADEPSQRDAAQWLGRAVADASPRTANDYAWLLSTSRFAEVRDGERALTHAKFAVEQDPTPAHLDTLAAAYAELGRYEDAVRTQQEAISALSSSAPLALVREFEAHLAAYRASKPWREPVS